MNYVLHCYSFFELKKVETLTSLKLNHNLLLVDDLYSIENILNNDIFKNSEKINNYSFQYILNLLLKNNKYFIFIKNIQWFLLNTDKSIKDLIYDYIFNNSDILFNKLINNFLSLFKFLPNNKIITEIDILKYTNNFDWLKNNKNLLINNLDIDKILKLTKIFFLNFLKDCNIKLDFEKQSFYNFIEIKNLLIKENKLFLLSSLLENILYEINRIKINKYNTYTIINTLFINNYNNIFFNLFNLNFNLFSINKDINKFINNEIVKLKNHLQRRYCINKSNMKIINIDTERYYYIGEVLNLICKKYYKKINNYIDILNETKIETINNLYNDLISYFGNNFINSLFIKRDNKSIKNIFTSYLILFHQLSFCFKDFRFIFKTINNFYYRINNFEENKYDENNDITYYTVLLNRIKKKSIQKTMVLCNIINSIIIKKFMINLSNNINISKLEFLKNKENFTFQNLNLKYNNNMFSKLHFERHINIVKTFINNNEININVFKDLTNIFKGFSFNEISMKTTLENTEYNIEPYENITMDKIHSYFLYRLTTE